MEEPANIQARARAAERLLTAWRGEIEAGAVYELISRRQQDPRRGEILRRMSEAEGGHRRRLENRMRELGVTIPDPASVRISPWLRLQARLAPIDRLLAAREAAENAEVGGVYKHPTGDAATDRLLAEIRRDEQAHSAAVMEMRAPRAAGGPPPPGGGTDNGALPTQGRLDRILGRESWHRLGTGWISGAIYGANDGLAAVFGIVSGFSGATNGSHLVLTAGLAGAIASALSMATGAFMAKRSEIEVAHANLERERQEITDHPEEEIEEISLFYQLKGIDRELADELAEKLSRSPEAMLKVLSSEELGGLEASGSATQAAIAAGISTGLGAMIPVIPFFFLDGAPGVIAAAVVSLVAHFLVGAAKSLVTLRSWWWAGLEMTAAGVIVGGATYLAGFLFKA